MLAGEHEPACHHRRCAERHLRGQFRRRASRHHLRKFVFQCTEVYRIEHGKIGAPLKGAMVIGNGPERSPA